MKVKTIRAHRNAHGETYEKAVGDVYSVPEGDAALLMRRKFVEEVPGARQPKAPAAKAE